MNDTRRAGDPLDDADRLTISEVHSLKRVAGYYAAGQIVLAVIVGVGAVAMFLVTFYDKAAQYIKH